MQIHVLSGLPLRETTSMDEALLPVRAQAENKSYRERVGTLIGMKINYFDGARKLRYAMLDDASLKSYGLTEAQILKLRDAFASAEGIYGQTGGTRAEFRKAITSGIANKDRKVPVTAAPKTLSGIEQDIELVLATKPEDFLRVINPNDRMLQALGNIDGDKFGDYLSSATDKLRQISNIANNVATITDTVDQARKGQGENVSDQSFSPDAQQAGFFSKNKAVLTIGGILALAMLGIYGFKVSDKDPAGRKVLKSPYKPVFGQRNHANHSLAGLPKKRKSPAGKKAKKAVRTKANKTGGVPPNRGRPKLSLVQLS